jgi:murein endopeptidase
MISLNSTLTLTLLLASGSARAGVGGAAPAGPWLEAGPDAPLAAEPDHEPEPCPTWMLRDGVELPELPELYHRMRPSRAWGTPELVDLLIETAAEVQFLRPDTDRYVVGDLSSRRGGTLSGHRSHKGGIDADVGLYFHDGRQHAHGFLEPNLAAFDTETNWLVIRTMLETGIVDRLLVDQRYVDKLRRHAISTGDLTKDEASAVFPRDRQDWWKPGVVHHAAGHKDHLHVRIRCER